MFQRGCRDVPHRLHRARRGGRRGKSGSWKRALTGPDHTGIPTWTSSFQTVRSRFRVFTGRPACVSVPAARPEQGRRQARGTREGSQQACVLGHSKQKSLSLSQRDVSVRGRGAGYRELPVLPGEMILSSRYLGILPKCHVERDIAAFQGLGKVDFPGH